MSLVADLFEEQGGRARLASRACKASYVRSRRNGRLAGNEVSISAQTCLPADRPSTVHSCSGDRRDPSREY